jgi:hypothetical protein
MRNTRTTWDIPKLLLTAVCTAVLTATLTAAPAHAEASCSGADYDRGTGLATASCTGGGQMRFIVRCIGSHDEMIWERNSDWLAVPAGGANMAYRFATCNGPKSNVVIGVR